jgi:hypothetical protein
MFSDIFSFVQTNECNTELWYPHDGYQIVYVCDSEDRVINIIKRELPKFVDLTRVILPVIPLVHKLSSSRGWTGYRTTPPYGVRCGQVVATNLGSLYTTFVMVALEDYKGYVVENMRPGDGLEKAPFACIRTNQFADDLKKIVCNL